jgi:hypothetical protein
MMLVPMATRLLTGGSVSANVLTPTLSRTKQIFVEEPIAPSHTNFCMSKSTPSAPMSWLTSISWLKFPMTVPSFGALRAR